MNSNTASLMTIPSPCGLAISSVTSDNEYLYALQPDRKTIYKLDTCGGIICVFKLQRKYTAIHFCGNGQFFATADGERSKIYILNKCFRETGYIEPDFSDNGYTDNRYSCGCSTGNSGLRTTLFTGPAGDCRDQNCMLTIANLYSSYASSAQGRILSHLSNSGKNQYYTAIAENNGILYEGLESRLSPQTFIRATLLSSGQTKVQRLPFGYRVRSFFCFGGRLYVFITKNSYHGYVAAVCTFINNGMLQGDIIALPDSPYDNNCCEESCSFGRCSSCRCGSSSCSGVSTNQTELCDNAVSGDSTEACDVDELCRLYNCLKLLCKDKGNSCGGSCGCSCGCGNGCHCGCGGVLGEYETSYNGGCCESGNLSCTCYPTCGCNEIATDPDNCLPLPDCPPGTCCNPCDPSSQNIKCCDDNLKVSFNTPCSGFYQR